MELLYLAAAYFIGLAIFDGLVFQTVRVRRNLLAAIVGAGGVLAIGAEGWEVILVLLPVLFLTDAVFKGQYDDVR